MEWDGALDACPLHDVLEPLALFGFKPRMEEAPPRLAPTHEAIQVHEPEKERDSNNRYFRDKVIFQGKTEHSEKYPSASMNSKRVMECEAAMRFSSMGSRSSF